VRIESIIFYGGEEDVFQEFYIKLLEYMTL